MKKIILLSLVAVFAHTSFAASAGRCKVNFKADSFIADYDSILDSAADFNRLATSAIMRFGDAQNRFSNIRPGSLLAIDRMMSPGGAGQLVVGRLVQVRRNGLRIAVNGRVIHVDSETGVGGINQIAILPASRRRGSISDYDSILDSERAMLDLTRPDTVIIQNGGLDLDSGAYRLLPLGGTILIDRMTTVDGEGQLVKGELVGRGRDYIQLRIDGQVRNFGIDTGVGGISSMAVLPD